jgi:hypothetical protein
MSTRLRSALYVAVGLIPWSLLALIVWRGRK